MSVEENKTIVRQAFAGLASGEFGKIRDVLAPEAVIHQCGFLHPLPVMELIERGGAYSPIHDRAVHLDQLIGEGDLVALRWHTDGVHTDPDHSANEAVPVSFPSMTFVRLADGKIAEIWNMRDADTIQSQLYQAQHAS
ncbi:MAG TPA: nuclear transport factor 2 family protein [Chloroflexota bacterium]|nr:nuclear transport factor 2 family protein [Chloroflexota bacterium]